jgi:hypothetical protein
MLATMRGNGPHSFEAAKWLGDHLYGKAPQHVEHTGTDGEPVTVIVTWGDVA